MMKKWCFCILFLALAYTVIADSAFITQERQSREPFKYDPHALKALDPVFAFYPDSSLVDFSFLLSPPAGKFGFVQQGDDGHFYFSETGKRIRFWGVVITQEHIDIPTRKIPEIVETLARAGINMVRFHAMDNRGGEEYGLVRRSIIDEGHPHENDSRHFNPDYFDRLDVWIAECKKRGIYVYLVLRGYRKFREGDKVRSAEKLDRAARPYAMFDDRLIELQKEYAHEFLIEHINPYTGLSYAADPAVAAIEIFNEDSLFMRPHMWQEMIEPYMSDFRKLWNEWLKNKYESTEKVKEAWTNFEGTTALSKDESLEKQNVRLPNMSLEPYDKAISADYDDPLRSTVRRHDAASFAIDLQNKYLKEMKTYLRDMGVKVPLTGVVDSTVVADTYTIGKELDFTAENAYYEHPIFLPGQEWRSQAFYKNINYMKDWGPWSLVPFVTRYKWADTPLGVREWATCWPNEYRASSILEMAAYARLQDLDLLTYFAYYTTGDFLRIGAFNLTCDPARWHLFGMGSYLFLSDSVSTAKHNLQIGYSAEDLRAWTSFMQRHHCIGWLSSVANRHLDTDTSEPTDYDFLILSGRTHNVDLPNAERSLIFSNCPFIDFRQHNVADRDDNIVKRCGYNLTLHEGKEAAFVLNGLGIKLPLTKTFKAKKTFDVQEIESVEEYEPLWVTENRCLGFYDRTRKNLVFAWLPETEIPSLVAQLLQQLYETPTGYAAYEEGGDAWMVSDTREIRRNSSLGLEFIDTPLVQVIQGELEPGKEYETGSLKIKSPNDFAVFVAMSLDQKPLKSSRRFVIKMMTRTWNRGQALVESEYPGRDDLFMLKEGGSALVQTRDEPSEMPVVITLNGTEVLSCYMKGGWWEAVLDLDEKIVDLACSGRNIKFAIIPPGTAGEEEAQLKMTKYYYDSAPVDVGVVANPITYPSFQKYIRLEWED